MEVKVGDIVIMKKTHPCGSKEWEIMRIGIDFRMKCCGCGRVIDMERRLVLKSGKIKDLK